MTLSVLDTPPVTPAQTDTRHGLKRQATNSYKRKNSLSIRKVKSTRPRVHRQRARGDDRFRVLRAIMPDHCSDRHPLPSGDAHAKSRKQEVK